MRKNGEVKHDRHLEERWCLERGKGDRVEKWKGYEIREIESSKEEKN